MQIATDAVGVMGARHGPDVTDDFQHDADAHSTFWLKGYELLAALPEKPQAQSRTGARRRDDPARRARERAKSSCCATRRRSMRALTKNQTQLRARRCACLCGGRARSRLVPTRAAGRRAKATRCRASKDGIEVDQGIFFAHILARRDTGTHFCHAMLLPKPEVARRGSTSCIAQGAIDFGTAAIERRGKAAIVFMTESALSSMPRTTRRCSRYRNRGRISRSSIRNARSACCAATRWSIRNMPASACSRTGINLTHLYSRQDSVPVVRHARDGLREQVVARPRASRTSARTKSHGATHREAVGRGVEAFRDRRRLPVSARRWTTWWRRATPT